MKLKKQIDPNIEETEIVIVARRQEEFSAIVKEYHLEDLSSIDNEKLYLATNKGFEIVNIRNFIFKIRKKLSRFPYDGWSDKSKISSLFL